MRGDLGLIPGLGRPPGEGKGYPFQYSGLENSVDYIVHGVAKSWTWLSNFHFYWHISPWVYPISDSLAFLGLGGYFLSNVREVFNYNLFKYFLIRCFFFYFFRDLYYLNVGVFNVVPEIFETVLITFYSFSLFCSASVISTIQSSSSLICSSASVILLFVVPYEFLISFVILFIADYLFLSLVCPC